MIQIGFFGYSFQSLLNAGVALLSMIALVISIKALISTRITQVETRLNNRFKGIRLSGDDKRGGEVYFQSLWVMKRASLREMFRSDPGGITGGKVGLDASYDRDVSWVENALMSDEVHSLPAAVKLIKTRSRKGGGCFIDLSIDSLEWDTIGETVSDFIDLVAKVDRARGEAFNKIQDNCPECGVEVKSRIGDKGRNQLELNPCGHRFVYIVGEGVRLHNPQESGNQDRSAIGDVGRS